MTRAAVQELGYSAATGGAECRCPQHLPLHWRHTDQCFAEFSRGPCEVNQYLSSVPGKRAAA